MKDFNVEAADQRLQEVQCREIYRLIGNLYSQEEAEAACQALIEKYPTVYFDVLEKNYILKSGVITAMNNFLDKQGESKYV